MVRRGMGGQTTLDYLGQEAGEKLWEKKYKDKVLGLTREQPSEPSAKRQKSGFSAYRNRPRGQVVYDIEDEYERYLPQPLMPRQADNWKALSWWVKPETGSLYPSLSKMAVDILSIPSMAASNERLYSEAKQTMIDARNLMDPETLEIIQ